MNFANIRLSWPLAAALLAAIATLSGAASRELQGQEIGTEICFCAPNVYEFTLDFSLTCPPVNITLGDAVAATTCLVSPFGEAEVEDLVPVDVTSIDVLELNQNLQIMVNENISPTKPFLDGDTFSYTSYAAIPGEIVNPEDLPRAIQLNVVGHNKLGQEIINMYLITFTSSCGAYPVLFEGQWAGWTRFSDLAPPNPELCPPARVPTPEPSASPTFMMSMSMSMSMDLGLEAFSIADLLEDEVVYTPKSYKSKGKGKGGKREKSEKSSDKLGKPNSKDGKAKDGKSKDGKSKDGAKAGKSKDGAKAGKSEKSKDGKDSRKDTNKLTKPGYVLKDKSKDGAKAGKSEKSKDGKGKDGKGKDGNTKSGAKSGAKAGAKAGKIERTKDGAKAGKSYKYEGNGRKPITEEQKEANKLKKSDKSKGPERLRI